MKARVAQPLSSELLAAYLEGEVTRHEAAHIEGALESCATSRRHLEELRQIRQALAAPAPEIESLDLVAAVRNKAQTQTPPTRLRRRTPTFSALAIAAGVAALAFGVAVLPENLPSAGSPEFRAKAASDTTLQDRWTGIRIHRVVAHKTPERVTDSLDRNDALLFSYTNLGPDPFEYLMIFAVGADRRVHWFYPAYETASEDPRSIDIEPGSAQLADAIEHDYSAGRLEVYALFSHQPEQVSRIETWFSQRAQPLEAAPMPHTRLQKLSLQVRP